MKKSKVTRSLLAACSIVALSAVLSGCLHSGGTSVSPLDVTGYDTADGATVMAGTYSAGEVPAALASALDSYVGPTSGGKGTTVTVDGYTLTCMSDACSVTVSGDRVTVQGTINVAVVTTEPEPKPDPAIAERAAINTAITAASAAVAGLTDDASDAAIGSAESAVAAAKTAVTGAANVPAAEKAAFNTAIAAVEGQLTTKKASITAKRAADADAMKADMAKAGKALHKALTANPLGLIGDQGADIGTTGLTIDADGNTGIASDPVLTAGDSAGSLGGWKGTNYAHTDSGTKVMNAAVVYTNQGAATTKTFASEYGTGNPSAGDGSYDSTSRTLTITVNADGVAGKIKGSKFPTVGSQNYPPDVTGGTDASFSGMYDGASGTYLCTTANATNGCSATYGSAGITLSGTWKFTHGTTAMVSRPDGNYLYFGWWLREDKDGVPTHASAFRGVEGTIAALPDNNKPDDLSGSATYTGKAAGKFAMSNPLDGTGSAGHFTADASLTATFGTNDAPNNGGMSGTIDNFMANGKSVPWSVALNRAPWANDADTFATPTEDDTGTTDIDERLGTVWSIDGNSALASGRWNGQMYDEDGEDGSNVPTTVTGTFQSEFSTIGRMVGAFGAERK